MQNHRHSMLIERIEPRLLMSKTIHTLGTFANTNGASPTSNLVMDSKGNLYGTTSTGGAGGQGAVFEIVKGSAKITLLASFTGSNGSQPIGGIILDSKNNLFGVAVDGGSADDGVIWELPAGKHTIVDTVSFNGTNGSSPHSLIRDSAGDLIGTAWGGGTNSIGLIFELPKGKTSLKTLGSFSTASGFNPESSLAIDSKGDLIGAASRSGNNDLGTIFELAKGKTTITAINLLTGGDGSSAQGVALDSKGNIWATAAQGGAYTDGTLLKISGSTHKVLADYPFFSTNGAQPESRPVIDAKGNVFGTTQFGGASGVGCVWELASGGASQKAVVSFNTTNGSDPKIGAVMLDSKDDIFGEAFSGGSKHDGTVFEVY